MVMTRVEEALICALVAMVPEAQSERGLEEPPVPPTGAISLVVPNETSHSVPENSAVSGAHRNRIWSMYQPARLTNPVTPYPLGQSLRKGVPVPPRAEPVVMVPVLAVQEVPTQEKFMGAQRVAADAIYGEAVNAPENPTKTSPAPQASS